MTGKLPRLPWSISTNDPVGRPTGSGFVYLLDANGRKIGTFWGSADEKMATAQLVTEAADAAAERSKSSA